MSKRKNQTEPDIKRRRAYKQEKESFLIFCEGENTEPCYFNSFRLKSAKVESISIRNGNALSFIKEIIKQIADKKDFDQYWAVFDMDNNSNQNFNEAIKLALRNSIKVAYSNLSFEYWLLCHFTFTTANINQRSLETQLTSHLGYKYNKDLQTTIKVCKSIFPYQNIAISNASRGFQSFEKPRNYANENSSTMVYTLVNELNRFID